MESKIPVVKTFICCFLLLIGFSCRSNPGEKIKLVLDNYDQSIKDYDSSMRQMYKDDPNVSFQKSLKPLKDVCDKVSKIDVSETPPDFRAAFKKLNSLNCDDKNSPADLTTYEGDPKTKVYNNAKRELEEISAKYGYIYKHPNL